MAQKITLEHLAEMIQDGFNEVHRILNDHKKEFAKIHKRIDKLETRFSKYESRYNSDISSIHSQLNNINMEITDIKRTLNYLSKRTLEDDDTLAKEYVSLDKRVTILERRYKELAT